MVELSFESFTIIVVVTGFFGMFLGFVVGLLLRSKLPVD